MYVSQLPITTITTKKIKKKDGNCDEAIDYMDYISPTVLAVGLISVLLLILDCCTNL